MFSADEHISNEFGIREEYDNIIKETRNMTKFMDQTQRFQKAKSHIIDALKNKPSRPINYSPHLPASYYILYFVQSSFLWDWLVFILSFVYMYLVILDNESYPQKIAVESSILAIFIIDTLIDFYCKSFDKFKKKKKYPSFYIWKTILISLMVIDLIIFATLPCHNSRPIRPFRILRAFIPVIFDPEIRKSLVSLVLAYKILFVFVIYYLIIIFVFALIGSRTLTFDPLFVDSSNPISFDLYTENYNHLGYMIFQVYAVATYDFYPDNAILAVQNYEPNYIFFIVFIFLNMFIFVTIPGGLIYAKFREIRSKYIIVDEIKQQHSLILAFVTLAQNETNLSIETLIKFLFYFYKRKIRYVEYITSICMKLDDNNNLTIQVNEFMQFSKLLLYNSIMYPPTFEDIEIWIKFRTFVNETFYLKKIVKHWIFNLITSIIIVLSAINTIINLNTRSQLTNLFDTIFIWLFFAELVLRIVGIGPEKYFPDRWNLIDTCMIMLNIIFLFVKIQSGLDNLVRLFRFFRIGGVFKLIIYSSTVVKMKIEIIEKLKRLFSTFLQIMPMICKFFFLFAFVFYIFGIIGMEVFYDPQYYAVRDGTSYSNQIQFSNFNTFLHSQYLMMQILTQGGWTYNAYDYCWRHPNYYAIIIAFFIFMHMTIVTVIGTLLRGVFWQIYFTVSQLMDQIEQRLHMHMLKEQQNQIKTQQMDEINQKIKNKETFDPDTVIKREIIEKKLDKQILIKIRNFQYNNHNKAKSNRSINRGKILGEMMESANVSPKELQLQLIKRGSPRVVNRKVLKKVSMTFHEIEDKEEQDFQMEMQELLNRLIISNKLKYSELIAYPKIFVEFLNSKFQKASDFLHETKFNLNNNPLCNEESMNFHAYQLTNLLGIESTSRQRKKMIIQTLLRNGLINQTTAEHSSKNQQSLSQFHIDTNGALRKMYLAQTNEDLVNKFQIQYFSDIYGNSFNKINKITLEPVLKFQATLTYTLWNILRYPEINVTDFFSIITHIEDQMSNKLLRKGSLVKFVYKLDHESDIWLVVEQKINQNMKIRFIKSGLWCQTAQMKNEEPYYSKDIFNWQLKEGTQENVKKTRDQYIKLFYQSFQTLAFTLIDKKHFFEYNPKEYIYDLYMDNFKIERHERIKNKQGKYMTTPLRISNIMLIVLSKEDQRLDIGQPNLPYILSEIKSKPKTIKDEDYILNNSQTYEKLKNLAAKQHEKIIQSQGLPFSYVLNMMKQISDMMKLYSGNYANQIENALNEQDVFNDSNKEEDGLFMSEIVVNVHEQLN